MRLSTINKLISGIFEGKLNSAYIPVKNDGRDIIRVSNHLPAPARRLHGDMTKMCTNVYLIFVKNKIDMTREDGVKLAKLIQLTESNNPEEKTRAEINLNNLIVGIGDSAKKAINYKIIDGNSEPDIREVIMDTINTLKISAFVPRKHITAD